MNKIHLTKVRWKIKDKCLLLMLVCGCKSNKRGSWPSSRQRTQKEDRKENAERGLAMDGLTQRTWKFHSP